MDAVSSVTKEMFRRYFIAALVSIGIPLDQANLFCCMNQRKRLMVFVPLFLLSLMSLWKLEFLIIKVVCLKMIGKLL